MSEGSPAAGRPLALEERAPRFPTKTAFVRGLDLDPTRNDPGREERVRAARLLLLGCWITLRRRLGHDGARPADTVLHRPLAEVARDVGLRRSEADQAVTFLREQSFLTGGTTEGWRLDESLFVAAPAAATLDWEWVFDQIAGESVALLVTAALAEHRVGGGNGVRRSLSDLGADTGYSRGAVRRGVDIATAAGVLERDDRSGRTPRYRFTERALGRPDVRNASAVEGFRETDPDPELPRAPEGPPAPHPAPTPKPTSASARLRIGPVTLHLPVGVDLELEVDINEAGQWTYRGGHFSVGPLPPPDPGARS